MKPDVSIIIPVFNVGKYLGACLASVISQNCSRRVECILVDDCGTDDSMDVAEKMISGASGKISFSIVRHECNRGLSAARNTGVKNASGDYVLFLDSDDMLAPGAVESLTRPTGERDYDIVAGDFSVTEGEDVFMHLSMPQGECMGRDRIATAKRKNRWYPMAWGKLYRRAFLLENGLEFCEGILNEDELFSVEAACLAESMYCLPDIASYIYRVRQGSIMTASRYEKRRESCERMLDHMYGFLRRHSLAGDAVCGDLLSYLFSYANEVSWRYSAEEYLKQYGKYRKIVSRRYGERLASDRRLKAVLRDLHFLLPACIGSRVFKFQNRLR